MAADKETLDSATKNFVISKKKAKKGRKRVKKALDFNAFRKKK